MKAINSIHRAEIVLKKGVMQQCLSCKYLKKNGDCLYNLDNSIDSHIGFCISYEKAETSKSKYYHRDEYMI